MLVKFIKVLKDNKLQEIFINPKQITKVLLAPSIYKTMLENGVFPEEMRKDHEFSTIFFSDGTKEVVVGAPSFIINTLQKNKQLLKG